MIARRAGTRGSLLNALPPSRAVAVRAADGTHLHAEVFGRRNAYPIVLAHGILCALRVWAYQIADLMPDYRVIAFDHRGHGRSGVPPRRGYTLDHLASDLEAVLDATLKPGERAVIAGHSMGGIAIAAWSERYPHRVEQRADAVALINTATGDLVREVKLLPVPQQLAPTRTLLARNLIRVFGGIPVPDAMLRLSRDLLAMTALGSGADPKIGAFIYDLLAHTPSAGRGGCARMLVNALGSRHISLTGLTVPTLVIGSRDDRVTPISQSRRIAAAVPNLVELVELPGGHCAMLEHPGQVNRGLRLLAQSAHPGSATPAPARRLRTPTRRMPECAL